MRLSGVVSSVLLFSAATSAWPSGWGGLEAAKREIAPLLARQQDRTTSQDQSSSASQGKSADSSSAAETGKNDGSASTTATGDSSKTTDDGGKTTGKSTGKSTETGNDQNTSKYQTTKTFDLRLPAGGVSMITPAAIAGPQYYKVGDYVTFAWNYTSLSITPSAVDILASCSLNQATYTIALNETIGGPSQSVTWDTGATGTESQPPFAVATYTLIIYDSDSSPDAQARAGYLGAYNQLTFGMYTPGVYSKLPNSFVCATCSGAMSSMEQHTLGFLLGTAALTVLSFGWFAGVAGLW